MLLETLLLVLPHACEQRYPCVNKRTKFIFGTDVVYLKLRKTYRTQWILEERQMHTTRW